MSKIKFYRRVVNILIGVIGKSNERIIMDLRMVSPLANDKGISINNKNVKKRILNKQNRGTRYR